MRGRQSVSVRASAIAAWRVDWAARWRQLVALVTNRRVGQDPAQELKAPQEWVTPLALLLAPLAMTRLPPFQGETLAWLTKV